MMSLRLALIDDENDLGEIYSYYLADLGHEVVHFNNAKKALNALKKTEVDVIITDLKMPHLTGIHLIQELTKFHKRPVPAILMIVEGEEENLENLKSFGFLDVLSKSEIPDKLALTLTEHFANTSSPKYA